MTDKLLYGETLRSVIDMDEALATRGADGEFDQAKLGELVTRGLRVNLSKVVGWQTPDNRPSISAEALPLVRKHIEIARTSADRVEAMASAAFLLTLWRYSDPPETPSEVEGLYLIAENYAYIRRRVEDNDKW